MRKIFTLLLSSLMVSAMAQESYTAFKVSGTNVPKIDGVIDQIWIQEAFDMQELTKVPEKPLGTVHPNLTEPEPSADDYSASFGMLWDETGLYVLFKVVDDIIVIEDDYDASNATPADQWWTDDNINILFSKDLFNNNFTQWEFAYQPMIDQEEKLSSDDWLNAALIDIELVESAWNKEGDVYTLETWISWEAFGDGAVSVSAEDEIKVEMRARDDDDDGTWESMYQWSTENYEIENNGEGMGTVTLSGQELEVKTIVVTSAKVIKDVTVYPNPSLASSKVQYYLNEAGNVKMDLYNLAGDKLRGVYNDFNAEGINQVEVQTAGLASGIYLLTIQSGGVSEKVYLMKR